MRGGGDHVKHTLWLHVFSRFRFSFHVGCYKVHCGPSPLEPDLSAEPFLRMQGCDHKWTALRQDGSQTPGTCTPWGIGISIILKECLISNFELLTSASSHRRVSKTLEQVVVDTACCLWERGSGIAPFPENMGSLAEMLLTSILLPVVYW